jgi:hypothetical protein
VNAAALNLAIRRLTMTEGPEAKDAPHPFTDEELHHLGLDDPGVLAWTEEHLPELRRSAFGQRLLYQSLGVGFVVGLAAHVGGYLLESSVTTEPLGLVANLLYALGWALWTGVVVVLFVQVVPEVKRRQIKRMLDAYEATLREQVRAGGDQASGDDERRGRGSGQAEQPPGCAARLGRRGRGTGVARVPASGSST